MGYPQKTKIAARTKKANGQKKNEEKDDQQKIEEKNNSKERVRHIQVVSLII